MASTFRVNETIRITAADLTDADGGAVTAGATVTVGIYDAAGALVASGSTSVAGSGDDWWVDLAAPATPGAYAIRIAATKDGALWEAATGLVVLPAGAITGYCSVVDVRARLDRTDAAADGVIAAVIAAASRAIDGYCNRRFAQVAEARYFTAAESGYLDVDDLVSVSEIATDVAGVRTYATVWDAADYDLDPAGAAGIGYPYTAIRPQPFRAQWFPTQRRGVRVTGVWGWPAIPDAVAEACTVWAIRLFKRSQAPFGVAGSAELGMLQVMPKVDPDVRALLDPYRRITIGAV